MFLCLSRDWYISFQLLVIIITLFVIFSSFSAISGGLVKMILLPILILIVCDSLLFMFPFYFNKSIKNLMSLYFKWISSRQSMFESSPFLNSTWQSLSFNYLSFRPFVFKKSLITLDGNTICFAVFCLFHFLKLFLPLSLPSLDLTNNSMIIFCFLLCIYTSQFFNVCLNIYHWLKKSKFTFKKYEIAHFICSMRDLQK